MAPPPDVTSTSSPEHPHQHQLVRSLGLLDIVMVGIAAMIAGAIFILIGPAINLAGGAVLIAFIINGVITLFTAMAYAELGSAMPEAGGGYLWVREGLPRPNAFISGWMAWLAHSIAGSLYAVGFASFLGSLLEGFGLVVTEPLLGIIPIDKLMAVACVAAFTYINIKGTSETGKTGNIVTVIQLGTIGALIIAGFWSMYLHPNWSGNFSDFVPHGIAGLVAAMGLTFIAFEGYEVIVQTGEEVKNPKKNIPRAIFISLGLVVTLYCLVAFVSIAGIFPEGTPAWQFVGENEELGVMKAAELLLPFGGFLVLAGGIVSSLAGLNATTFSSARVAFAMGRHYNLPHILSSIHSKNKTPHVAIAISGVIMAVMAYALPLDQIAVAAGVIFLLLFTQVNISVITIRKIHGNKLDYGFKTPLFPAIPIVGIFLKLGLAFYLLVTQPLSWGIAGLWVLVGFILYRMYTFKQEVEHYAPVITSEGDLARKDFRILMPYTPENPDRLLKYAIRVAKENDGEISVLRVITVPQQTPLSAGAAFVESSKRAFAALDQILDKEDVLNHYFVRVSHDATEAILATIEEQRIDLLVTDFETLRTNKKLQTLTTCSIMAIDTTGGGIDDTILSNNSTPTRPTTAAPAYDINNENIEKKKLVVIYDEGDHSDLVLKTTSWLEHSGLFNVHVLLVTNKETLLKQEEYLTARESQERKSREYGEDNHDNKNKSVARGLEKEEYLSNIGIEFDRVIMNEDSEKDAHQSANLISAAINASQPDIVVTGASIGKFSIFDTPHYVQLVERLNCPVIIMRSFSIPGVNKVKSALMRLVGR
ncbi:MAG TPA: amino acid permease [Nitrososphaeraceae archaeon]|nr:amino acid permease [Nitrososphaeraceae archaeon]